VRAYPRADRVEEHADGPLQGPGRRLEKEARLVAVDAEDPREVLRQLVVVVDVDPRERRHELVEVRHQGRLEADVVMETGAQTHRERLRVELRSLSEPL